MTTVPPTFRYLDDITRYLTSLEKEVDESRQVIMQQQKLLAALITKAVPVKAAMVFDVSPTDPKEQRKTLRKLKTQIDPNLTKVVVPNMKKLQSQYNLAEDLYSKLKAVESVETTLSLNFPNRRGDQYEATVAQIRRMKKKIEDQLRLVFKFLGDVATKHVPTEFIKYVELVAELVNEHVIFKESQIFVYASVDDEGNLLFTAYILLQDAVNDEGDIAPHLYISLQWRLSEHPTMTVDLNHEYDVPNKLIGSGEVVGSVGEAVKAIADKLEIENFSSALGVVPLALQLKVDPAKLVPEMFSYRDLISKVIVDENTISFKLRKEADSPETVKAVAYQLYKELKELMKSKQVRLTMKLNKVAGSNVITFNIVKIAEGGEFNAYDLEWMRDKFGLNNQAIKKIADIVNNQASLPASKPKANPGSDLSDLTRKSHEDNKLAEERRHRERRQSDKDE